MSIYNTWAHMTPEEAEERRAKLRAANKARWAAYTPERRAEVADQIREGTSRGVSHHDCDHPKTAAGRARCRKRRAREAGE